MPFGSSDSDLFNDLFVSGRIVNYGRGETILRAGEEPQGIFLIVKGFVRIYSVREDGQELSLSIYKEGSCFPLLWALGNIPNEYSFEALTDVELKRIPREAAIEYFQNHCEEFYGLMKRVFVGLDGILTNVEYQLSGDAYHRIVSVLYLTAKRFGEADGPEGVRIPIPLAHQNIASLSAVSRETASLMLEKLKDRGLIVYQRKCITVADIEKLERETNIYKSAPQSQTAPAT